MGFPKSADGTPQTTNPYWTLSQSEFQREDDGSTVLNIDGRALGTPAHVWDGTGTGDVGTPDWTDNGLGGEAPAANHTPGGTNGYDTGVSTGTGDISRFTNPSGDSDIAGSYQELRFWMQPKAFPAGAALRIEWQNAANDVVSAALNVANYVTNMDLDVWQQVSIPIADFNLTGDAAKFGRQHPLPYFDAGAGRLWRRGRLEPERVRQPRSGPRKGTHRSAPTHVHW